MDAAASPEAPPAAPPRHEFTATPETPKLLPRTIYGPEHEDYRRGVRRFFETEVYPHWEAWEAQGHVARRFDHLRIEAVEIRLGGSRHNSASP